MMKKILVLLIAAVLIYGCEAESNPTEESQMVVYLVDYESNAFQAGTVLNFSKLNISYDQLEIDIEIDPIENNLDGAVSLLYDPTNDKIFEGSLNIDGNASINFPGMTPGADFYVIDNTVSLPPNTMEDIGGPYNESVGNIWNAIDQLGLTEIFVDNDPLIGRFLYKPNETNVENWKWIIMLLDQ